jgi:hypothetical protein
MKMSVNEASVKLNRIMLTLEHAGESFNWSVYPFNKRVFTEDVDVCEHINAFWSSLPLGRQQKIFEIYKQIYTVMDTSYGPEGLILELRPLIKQLYIEHPLEEIDRWIAFHSQNIHIPTKLDETFVHSDESARTRDKTYTRPDYVKLVGLTLALRPMIPIWGEFIERTHKETGTLFKEYYAYQLLAQTKLNESQAMEKLLIFIRSYLQGVDLAKNPNLVMDGLGTEEYDQGLLGSVLVTRICVGDIRGSDTAPGLVITSYKYITGRIGTGTGSSGGNYGEMIRPKDLKSSGSGSDEHQEVSQIEAYKIKQQMPIGAIAPFEHFLDNPHQVAERVYPAIDHVLLDLLIKTAHMRQAETVWPHQISITKIVLARVISPDALEHTDKPHTLTAMAIAQSVLWQKGHRKIAGLVTAVATNNVSSQLYSGPGVMLRIPKELSEEIAQLYPYQRRSTSRTKTAPQSAALQAIDRLAEQFNMRDWILMLPDALAVELVGTSNNRRYPCPLDMKIQLARLTIEIAKRV